MENYEALIMQLCKGETPKQKYDWLFNELSKLSSAKSFVHALHGTWDEASIKNIRNFINDINEKLRIQNEETEKRYFASLQNNNGTQ